MHAIVWVINCYCVYVTAGKWLQKVITFSEEAAFSSIGYISEMVNFGFFSEHF
jgi:hypothetical protein